MKDLVVYRVTTALVVSLVTIPFWWFMRSTAPDGFAVAFCWFMMGMSVYGAAVFTWGLWAVLRENT